MGEKNILEIASYISPRSKKKIAKIDVHVGTQSPFENRGYAGSIKSRYDQDIELGRYNPTGFKKELKLIFSDAYNGRILEEEEFEIPGNGALLTMALENHLKKIRMGFVEDPSGEMNLSTPTRGRAVIDNRLVIDIEDLKTLTRDGKPESLKNVWESYLSIYGTSPNTQ